MRRSVLLAVLVFGLIGGLAAATWTTVRSWVDSPLQFQGRATLHIPPGAAFRDVAAELHYIGIIRRPELFTLYARYKGLASKIKAGRHKLEPPLTPRGLLDILVNKAPRRDVKVTIPEGSNVWQVADLMEAAGVCGRGEFLEAVPGFEGRLFPDTYFFHPGAAPQWVIRALTNKFNEVWRSIGGDKPGPKAGGLAELGVLTLASLVEEEAQLAEERPRIARVFYNRLAKGMRLETDPTCVYAEATYTEVPSPKRCKDPANRWSTYVIPGLPPTPISSPGRASMQAALAPSSDKADAELLYFVARRDGTGGHHFSRTYAEHSKAVTRYLKGR